MPTIGSTITQPAGNNWPTDDANTIIGGIHSVADATARDAIPAEKRREGMLCYLVSDESTYMLINGITNSDWVACGVIKGMTPGYIPVATSSSTLGNSVLKQDLVGTVPILRYNCAGADPTGDTNIIGFYNKYSDDYYVNYCSSINGLIFNSYGILQDDMLHSKLTRNGWSGHWTFSPYGLYYIGSAIGSAGDIVSCDASDDPNRIFGFWDTSGPGVSSAMSLGYGPQTADFIISHVKDPSFPGTSAYDWCNSSISLQIFTDTNLYKEVPALFLGKSRGYNKNGVNGPYVTTLDGDQLGEIVFQGVGTEANPGKFRQGAVIRCLQNGDAFPEGVPVNLTIETCQSSGTNTNQFVLKYDGTINLGTITSTQKLHVAGDIDVDSTFGFRINNTATSGRFLRGDGTRFVSSAIQAGDLPNHGVTIGTMPVATSANAFGNSFIKQTQFINVPYISYNATPINPTGDLSLIKVFQQYSDRFHVNYFDLTESGLYGLAFEINGLMQDGLAGAKLLSDGFSSSWLFCNYGLLYYPSSSGVAGDVVTNGGFNEFNRSFNMIDGGPDSTTSFSVGLGSSLGDFTVSRNRSSATWEDCTSTIAAVTYTDSNAHFGSNSARLFLGRSHGYDINGYGFVKTELNDELAFIRFRGVGSEEGPTDCSSIDARIWAKQSGASVANGIPVNLYFETSNGSAWRTNQLVLLSDGTVNIGTATATQKLHVAGSIDIDSGNTYKVNNVQVLATRDTGWTTPTGSAIKANASWDTETITDVKVLARAVKALIDAGITHGFLGA